MKATARWKPGSRVKTPAEIADALVKENIDQHDGFNAEAFFWSQQPEDAPLHNEFEWDKDKAFVAYNVTRSNYICRSLEHVIIESEDSEPVVIRAFSSMPSYGEVEGDQDRIVYRSTEGLLSNPRYRDVLIARAISDAKAFKRKYAQLSEASRIIQSLELFLDDVG